MRHLGRVHHDTKRALKQEGYAASCPSRTLLQRMRPCNTKPQHISFPGLLLADLLEFQYCTRAIC